MRSKEIISEALNKQDMVYNGGGIFASMAEGKTERPSCQ